MNHTFPQFAPDFPGERWPETASLEHVEAIHSPILIIVGENDHTYLEERLARYDEWIREGKVPCSSKVIPIRESLAAQQWVLPTEQVAEFLRNARSLALADCVCRGRYRRCDHPLEVCFLLDSTADQYVAEGIGRRVSLKEAVRVLRQANEQGLVHLTIYEPDHHVYAVCSCCPCCCHDLQFLRRYGRGDLIAHSEYVAETDMDMWSSTRWPVTSAAKRASGRMPCGHPAWRSAGRRGRIWTRSTCTLWPVKRCGGRSRLR